MIVVGTGNDDTTSEVNSLFQLNEKMRARMEGVMFF